MQLNTAIGRLALTQALGNRLDNVGLNARRAAFCKKCGKLWVEELGNDSGRVLFTYEFRVILQPNKRRNVSDESNDINVWRCFGISHGIIYRSVFI